MIYCFRFQPLKDKPDEKPVFDANSEAYQNHSKIELDKDNVKFLWNNGKQPKIGRRGNLACEAINDLINRYIYMK